MCTCSLYSLCQKMWSGAKTFWSGPNAKANSKCCANKCLWGLTVT